MIVMVVIWIPGYVEPEKINLACMYLLCVNYLATMLCLGLAQLCSGFCLLCYSPILPLYYSQESPHYIMPHKLSDYSQHSYKKKLICMSSSPLKLVSSRTNILWCCQISLLSPLMVQLSMRENNLRSSISLQLGIIS